MKSVAGSCAAVAKATAAALLSVCVAMGVAASANADPVTPCSFNPPLPECPWSINNPGNPMSPMSPMNPNSQNDAYGPSSPNHGDN